MTKNEHLTLLLGFAEYCRRYTVHTYSFDADQFWARFLSHTGRPADTERPIIVTANQIVYTNVRECGEAVVRDTRDAGLLAAIGDAEWGLFYTIGDIATSRANVGEVIQTAGYGDFVLLGGVFPTRGSTEGQAEVTQAPFLSAPPRMVRPAALGLVWMRSVAVQLAA